MISMQIGPKIAIKFALLSLLNYLYTPPAITMVIIKRAGHVNRFA